jgi:hypothetical protein
MKNVDKVKFANEILGDGTDIDTNHPEVEGRTYLTDMRKIIDDLTEKGRL